ncbi:radical SAM protein [uncultured Desulfuromonas sp.]|uniref:radical SAM protein n=1 Tax=uncultured Desulfuromonas sp. TaxID=181013 RepID=UPI002AAA94B0|nr:radical SAM protein [uncultured Desulfuromonas sp.]
MIEMICPICEHQCRLEEGKAGRCELYELSDGHLVERQPDRYLVACPISIETMPMLHFQPGAKFLQLTTTGCNFDCPGCISTVLVKEMNPDSAALEVLTPQMVIDRALDSDCEGIAFLMNDPLAAFPRFLAVAELAFQNGLSVGCSTNGYFSTAALEKLVPYLDFINFGMKGFSDASYQACGGARLAPVLRNIERVHDAGIHIEVSCVYQRSNRDEVMALGQWLSRLDRQIPLQVMRFLPFEGATIDEEPSISEAEALCLELQQGLHHVYLFNSPGSPYLNSHCCDCGREVIRRDFYGPMGAKLLLDQSPALVAGGRCPQCDVELPVKGTAAATIFEEGDFQGGYPLTRALEMVEAMLIAMGVVRQQDVAQSWEDLLQGDGLQVLHQHIQDPRRYLNALHYFGRRAGRPVAAAQLADYLEHWLDNLDLAMTGVTDRPRVYYAMGKTLFAIGPGRLENRLVELAGGESLNRQLPVGGRPGRRLTVDKLNELNPQVIVMSAFMSSSKENVLAECAALGIDVEAVRNQRIIVHPAAGWDFGSPRWILGLLHLATIFHPERCRIDVLDEAQQFYRRFYGVDFIADRVNRSFAKPSSDWYWPEQKKAGNLLA